MSTEPVGLPIFSRRLPHHTGINALSRALDALRAAGASIADLTESNPTRVGLPYPPGVLAPLADPRSLFYDPDPLGLAVAREAIAADAARRGAAVDPSQVVLSASTSEAYSWLFKLLCTPGDHVLVPQPSYPLFEHLTRLDGVQAAPYPLVYHGRWEIDVASLDTAPPDTRALLLVTPNNPTGSMVSPAELDRLVALCGARGWALVADEVFADYPLEGTGVTDVASRADVLSFTLGGASKSLGLPQLKLGWTVVGGPPRVRAAALEALALIADTYLSVSTPVQLAAPVLFREGAGIREAIRRRVRQNLEQARRIAAQFPSCDVLRAEGGWALVIRVPAVRTEEQLVLELLERERVLVHPGYFFDFPHETFLVASLLPPDAVFADAFTRMLRVAGVS